MGKNSHRSEARSFKEIFNSISISHPNLNINLPDGQNHEDCYLHLYVGVDEILIHKD